MHGPVQRQNRSGHLATPFKHVVGNRGQGSFLELFHSAIPFLSLDDLVLLVLLSRRIWQARNEELFQHKYVSSLFLFFSSSEFYCRVPVCLLLFLLLILMLRLLWFTGLRTPSFPFFKLNVDGAHAVDSQNGLRGLGAVRSSYIYNIYLASCNLQFYNMIEASIIDVLVVLVTSVRTYCIHKHLAPTTIR